MTTLSILGVLLLMQPGQTPVTIDQLVADALSRAPAIRAAAARKDAASGRVTQAGLRANPELTTNRKDEWGGMNAETSVGVSLPLELGRRDARMSVAVQEVAVASAAADEAARQLTAAVRLAAVRVLAADRTVAIGADLVGARREWRDLVAARVANGLSAAVDRDAAEVELRLAQAELTRRRAEAAGRWAELRAVAGLGPTAPLALSESLEDAVRHWRSASPPRPEADAAAARPDVRELDAAVAAAGARESLARREGRLDIRLDAAYARSAVGFPQFGLTAGGTPTAIVNRMNEVMFGATVTLPWRNRNQGAAAEAAAEGRAMSAEREGRWLTAQAEIVAADARDLEAGRALEIWSGGVLELAARNLSVARQSYQAGRLTRLEVLAEERRYLELQTAYIAALSEGYEARVVLTQALGGSR